MLDILACSNNVFFNSSPGDRISGPTSRFGGTFLFYNQWSQPPLRSLDIIRKALKNALLNQIPVK